MVASSLIAFVVMRVSKKAWHVIILSNSKQAFDIVINSGLTNVTKNQKLLKIADFDLSWHLIAAVRNGASPEDLETTNECDQTSLLAPSRFRRLVRLSDRPIMSPLKLTECTIWRHSIYIYPLFVGTLPLRLELATCPPHLKFSERLRSWMTEPHSDKLCSMQQGRTLALELQNIPSETGTDATELSNLRWSPNQATEFGGSSLNGKSSESMGFFSITSCRGFPVIVRSFNVISSAIYFLLAPLLHPDPNKNASRVKKRANRS
ncbi:hypothetical protein PsorP6_003113 [Peronosclerospora sorghi]|uniref:Uncharacterized protein n=1 Tax=Peronosclerospora sorghi TaxID=230839 RepID=A0ACC0VP18_9STRA|nr:hypothetical protein PsorP6_003113 [Peronosclerospora sorghi]